MTTDETPPNPYGPPGFFLARLPDGSHVVYQAVLTVSPEALASVRGDVEELLGTGVDVRMCAVHDPTTIGAGPIPGVDPPPPPPPPPPGVSFLQALIQVKPGKKPGDP